MSAQPWRKDFPDLPHAPQNLDLVRRHLSWSPAERLENLRRVQAFVARARRGRWLQRPAKTATDEPEWR